MRQTIELNRLFVDARSVDVADAALYALFPNHTGTTLHWSDLLKARCAVVLGEAGTGKSTEFRLRSEELAGGGQPAFFLPIEELDQRGFSASLGLVEKQRFENWQLEATGYIFLDSLDESLLRGGSFDRALRNLKRDLGHRLDRAKVFVSSRVSDWRADSDLDALRVALDMAEPGSAHQDKNEPPIMVVTLAPLTEGQLVTLADFLHVHNATLFAREIRNANADAFAERPRDVEWLVAYWNIHGALGCLRDLAENNVCEKLKESNLARRQRDAVSPASAREGAAIVAGLLTVSRKAFIALHDETLNPERGRDCLDPQKVLPDWTARKVNELLTRAVFDEATYGRVRLHHRTTQEFLTAEWLLSLLRRELPRSKMHSLVFRFDGEDQFVAPELRGAVAWLCLWDDDVRDMVVASSPEVLMGEGDPGGLSVDIKITLIRSLAKKYGGRNRRSLRLDNVMLRRFAASELSGTIEQFLDNDHEPEELREILLEVVREGKILGCAKSALRLALDRSISGHLRAAAILAVGAVGATADTARLVEALISEIEIDQDLAGPLVRALYPARLDVASLLDVLAVTKTRPRNLRTSLAHLLSHEVPKMTPPTRLPELVQGLIELHSRIDRWWLVEPLATATAALLEVAAPGPFTPPIASALELWRMRYRRGAGEVHEWHALDKVVRSHPWIRRNLFWTSYAAHQADRAKRRRVFGGYLLEHGAVRLTAADAEWLVADAKHLPTPSARYSAFCSLLWLPVDDPSAKQQYLDAVFAARPEFEKTTVRRGQRGTKEDPGTSARERMAVLGEQAGQRQRKQNLHIISTYRDSIRDGSRGDLLMHLLLACKSVGDASRINTTEDVVSDYGRENADAFRAGLKAYWTKTKPPLLHEESARHAVSDSVVVGLNGIAVDIEDGLDLSELSPIDAETATRYATRELNRLPDWLDTIAGKHPDVVYRILLECIRADFELGADAEGGFGVLAMLPNSSERIRRLLYADMLAWLERGDPEKIRILEQCLGLLLADENADRARIQRLAASRWVSANADRDRSAVWWCAWFCAAPGPALSALDVLLQSQRATGDQELALAFLDQLWRASDDHSAIRLVVPKTARILRRLVSLLFVHSPPEMDPRHERAYSPSRRDHAAMLRSRAVSWLTASPGRETVTELRSLGDEPRFTDYRDYFMRLADERVAQNATMESVDVAQELIDLYCKYGSDAINHLSPKREPVPELTPAAIAQLNAHGDGWEAESLLAHGRPWLERGFQWVFMKNRTRLIWTVLGAAASWLLAKASSWL